MDILTHAMTGVILGSPLAATSPLAAGGVVLGSVLPDLDVLARVFGKVRLLRFHQTYTHSLPLIAVVTGAACLAWRLAGMPEPWAPLGLGGGMLLHSLMDAGNTYGAALLAPLRRKRYAAAWVFFIDAVTVALCVVFAVPILIGFLAGRPPTSAPAAGFAAATGVYWAIRYALWRRALRLQPAGTLSLVPSALWPVWFYGFTAEHGKARLFRLNVLAGRIEEQGELPILDDEYPSITRLPEFRLMRELSSGYHVVESRSEGGRTVLVCRDLRTRNFGGRFGVLEVTLGPGGDVRRKVFHV